MNILHITSGYLFILLHSITGSGHPGFTFAGSVCMGIVDGNTKVILFDKGSCQVLGLQCCGHKYEQKQMQGRHLVHL